MKKDTIAQIPDVTWCGLNQHVVNFAVLQTSCSSCQDKELEPKSKCDICGNRCNICSKKDKRKQYIYPPCTGSCGFREHIFKGDNAASQFCSHILREEYKESILIAHNAKSFDLYPILEVLIDQHAILPDKIIYNGTKVMYMHIAKQLNLTFLDSLNFLPMKLSDIPKAFGLEAIFLIISTERKTRDSEDLTQRLTTMVVTTCLRKTETNSEHGTSQKMVKSSISKTKCYDIAVPT